MIKANELRIGNVLKGDELSIPRENLYHNGVTKITGFGISMIQSGNITSLKAIPLNEKVLKTCGFVYKSSDYESPAGDKWWFSLRNGFIPEGFKHTNFKGVKFLHELQNLYYYLYGHELDVDSNSI